MDVGGKQPRLGTLCMNNVIEDTMGMLPQKSQILVKKMRVMRGFMGTLFSDRPKYQDCRDFVSYAAKEAGNELVICQFTLHDWNNMCL